MGVDRIDGDVIAPAVAASPSYVFGIATLAALLGGEDVVGVPVENEWYYSIVDEAGVVHKYAKQHTTHGFFEHYFNDNRTYFYADASFQPEA